MTNNTDFSTRSGNVQRVDALARAMRQAVVRTVRMTALKGNPSMAKTLRSRIAAVAVAALAGGLVQAFPAQAALANATPFFVSAAEYSSDAAAAGTLDGTNAAAEVSLTQIAGANNYVTLTAGYDTSGATNVYVDVAGSTITSFTNSTNVSGTLNASATRLTYGGNDLEAAADASFRVATPSVGTITVKITKSVVSAGAATDTVLQTFTVTVNSAATVNVYSSAKSTVYMTSDATAAASSTTDAAVLATPIVASASGTATTAVARFDSAQKDANGTALASGFKTVTATITGAGALGLADTGATGAYVSEAAQATDVYVFPDGRSGVGTVTITVNGVTVMTRTVSFYGAVATLTATQLKYSLSDGAASTSYVKITAKDANGVAVPLRAADGAPVETTTALAVTAVDDANNGTAAIDVTLDPTATKTGLKTVTWKHTATGVTVSTSVVVSGVVDSATVTTDKTTYAPGDVVKVTVTAKDAAGNIAVDGATSASSVAVTTGTFQNATLPTTLTFSNGSATFNLYAPGTTGDFSINVKFAAGADWSDNVDDVTKSVTVKVAADTTAIDAAKAAADAAKAEAAKATAAVAALTATISSIQTAISTLVASTTATLTMIGAQIAKIMKKLKI